MPEPISFTHRRFGLTTGQTLKLAIIGAVLWFAAAALLRTIGPSGAFDGNRHILLYALTVPATVPFVWLVQKLVELDDNKVAIGYSLATATALLLDGVAVAWFPALYGTESLQVTNSAAAILWGAGVGIFLAFVMNKEPTT